MCISGNDQPNGWTDKGVKVMRMTKIQMRKAQALVDEWRASGVPFWVTAYEAHRITDGVVGVVNGMPGAAKAMHLVELASALVKQDAKAVR